MAVELPTPLGVPDVDPIGGAVARARKKTGIRKGFEEHGAEVVTGFSVPHELLGRERQDRRGQIFHMDPGQNQKSRVIDHEGQMTLTFVPRPANEVVSGASAHALAPNSIAPSSRSPS